MLVSGIVSRPRYGPFSLDLTGRTHLLVFDDPKNAAEISLGPRLDANVEIWTAFAETRVSQQPRQNSGFLVRDFRSTAQLFNALQHRLRQERIGFRLYAMGVEAFIWDAANLAREMGMDSSEYRAIHAGSEQRRVYCVHCRTVTGTVKTNIVQCSGCGAHLSVRDHYSRRLAAFMGVQIDAETPGQIPVIEETFA